MSYRRHFLNDLHLIFMQEIRPDFQRILFTQVSLKSVEKMFKILHTKNITHKKSLNWRKDKT